MREKIRIQGVTEGPMRETHGTPAWMLDFVGRTLREQAWFIDELQTLHAQQKNDKFIRSAAAIRRYDEAMYKVRIVDAFANFNGIDFNGKDMWQHAEEILAHEPETYDDEFFSGWIHKLDFIHALKIIDTSRMKVLLSSAPDTWKRFIKNRQHARLHDQWHQVDWILQELDYCEIFEIDTSVEIVRNLLETNESMYQSWVDGFRRYLRNAEMSNFVHTNSLSSLVLLRRFFPDFFEKEIRGDSFWPQFWEIIDTKHLSGRLSCSEAFNTLADLNELRGEEPIRGNTLKPLPVTRSY